MRLSSFGRFSIFTSSEVLYKRSEELVAGGISILLFFQRKCEKINSS